MPEYAEKSRSLEYAPGALAQAASLQMLHVPPAAASGAADEDALQGLLQRAPRVRAVAQLQMMFNQSPRVRGLAQLQRALNGCTGATAQTKPGAEAANKTGLPDGLKAGIESLSGIPMDGVEVHYNSPQPAQLNALAYAQGAHIHVAPGQEKHLPHEAWHVVQQAQGRVKPTLQMNNGVPVNDEKTLEREADSMGARAVTQAQPGQAVASGRDLPAFSAGQPVQRVVPTATGLPKPPADVEGYAPHGKDKIFRADQFPRRMFAFQQVTKERVIAKSDPVVDHNQVTLVRAGGNLEPLAGAQMDHIVSWDSIVQVMDAHNRLMDDVQAPLSSYYTLRDARLYYNDVSNLHFVLGAHNAAAGASGVPQIEDVHQDFRAPTRFIGEEWMNLQQIIHAVSGGVTPDQAVQIFDRLAELGEDMRQTYNLVAGMIQTGPSASSSSQAGPVSDDTAMDES
jgi:hypothetical protein